MRVLVATDGSRAGGAALKFASHLVRSRGTGELIVVTVCPVSPRSIRAGGKDPRQAVHARRVLAAAARDLRRPESPPARFEMIHSRNADEVPEAISRHADRVKADLVVVGSEGRESLTEWVVGGTALRLIYVARRPVTVVRAPRRRRTRGATVL
ncbi:MAG TPA: universal stress protein [Thermoanaerobaculia bacterium]